MEALSVTLVTDPWSPGAWAAQPKWRRLLAEFGAGARVTYVQAPPPPDPARWAVAWLDAAEASGMPVDPRRLLDGRGSPNPVPAALAVVAVAEQADPGPYLRALQEAIFLSRRGVERGDALLELAREVGGLDLRTLELAFGSNAIVEQLGSQRDRASALPAPCVVLGDAPVTLAEPYEAWREAAVAAGGEPQSLPDVDAALRRFGPMTTAEVAEVCGLPGPRAAAELWSRAMEWRVSPRPVLGWQLWRVA